MAISIKGPILFVRDMDRMAEFYGAVLGLTYETSPHDDAVWTTFVDGGCTFALHAIPDQYRPEITSPPAVRESTPTKMVFRVDDIEGLAAKLVAQGLEPLRGSVAEGVIDFHDPEGNVFQLTDQ